ncbi:Gamma carbonic anhydrase 1, mitochondrial [Porphyridium purpureum]|uniref:Gamma carbonic anhydrase 1, mitochondrial n=1 Tax=Porphyridium purpureum TaxID=35688 RepID=A0A5J4YML4_PORPP|nr:Gamma carbonic anhydrase 1, mitochondrial [Porphyridium purpureum]|eukprot:POR7973..scf295_9
MFGVRGNRRGRSGSGYQRFAVRIFEKAGRGFTVIILGDEMANHTLAQFVVLVRYEVGMWIRETGLALDRVGLRWQGQRYFAEALSRHNNVLTLGAVRPLLGEKCFVAPSAAVHGEVTIADGASVWYSATLRGDSDAIEVGSNTNIQDHAVVLTYRDYHIEKPGKVIIGDNVTIGHGALIRAGVRIGDTALIGMNAVLMEDSSVQRSAMLAASAVLPKKAVVPEGELWAGNPAKFMRNLTPDELASMADSASNYAKLAQTHRAANGLSADQVSAEANREGIARMRDIMNPVEESDSSAVVEQSQEHEPSTSTR